MLGVNMEEADEDDGLDGVCNGNNAAAFERIFDDDLAAEESKAIIIR